MNERRQSNDAAWRQLVFPPGYENPKPASRYHLVVVGAGPAGLVVSIAAAGLGARVALIERGRMGGDCLNVGCVPSKSLLEFTAARARPVDFDAAFEHLSAVRARIAEHDSVERYSRAGVDVFLGSASLDDAETVSVGNLKLKARRIVLATGARAILPPIPGLEDASALTNETIFDLREQPARLAVLGGGAIGCELAQAFSRMGSQVTIIERLDEILSGECRDARQTVAAALLRDGISVMTGTAVEKVSRSNGTISISAGGSQIEADALLVAAGRRANTEGLGLDKAGVAVSEAGLIVVDDKLRTTNKRIFAAGDICAAAPFTQTADAHARIVVENALFVARGRRSRLVIPHCTYTSPEVARVGPTAEELEKAGTAFDRHGLRFGDLDRGRTQADDEGFVEVLTAAGKDRILGATIVGHDAGEQIAAICIAMTHGLGLGQFSSVVLPYPTRAEYLRRLADNYNRGRLTPAVRRLFSAWMRWTA